MFRSLIIVTVFSAFLSGCSTVLLPSGMESLSVESNQICSQTDPHSIDRQECDIRTKITNHIKDLKSLQYERGAYNLVTFGAAVVGASAITFSWNADILATAGLVGGGAQGLNLMGNPAAKQKLLMKAVSGLSCVLDEVESSTRPKKSGDTLQPIDNVQIASLMEKTTRSIEDRLLVGWFDTNSDVDYKAVIESVSKSAEYKANSNSAASALGALASTAIDIDYAALTTKLAECATK